MKLEEVNREIWESLSGDARSEFEAGLKALGMANPADTAPLRGDNDAWRGLPVCCPPCLHKRDSGLFLGAFLEQVACRHQNQNREVKYDNEHNRGNT